MACIFDAMFMKEVDVHTVEFTSIHLMLQWLKDGLISWCFEEMGSSSKLF